MFDVASTIIIEMAKFMVIAVPLILVLNIIAYLLWGGR